MEVNKSRETHGRYLTPWIPWRSSDDASTPTTPTLSWRGDIIAHMAAERIQYEVRAKIAPNWAARATTPESLLVILNSGPLPTWSIFYDNG